MSKKLQRYDLDCISTVCRILGNPELIFTCLNKGVRHTSYILSRSLARGQKKIVCKTRERVMAEVNFLIELDEKKGRVLVAKRSLQQGELILHEKPLGKI